MVGIIRLRIAVAVTTAITAKTTTNVVRKSVQTNDYGVITID